MVKYFLDTYALIEIAKGNENYRKYLEAELFTSIFNLYELFFIVLRDYNEETAKKYFFQFKELLLRFGDEAIFEASKFRLENRKKGFSYTDALGYIISLENNLIFLTGDEAFKGFNNTKIIK